jgi:DHA1 family multidrug resistance protein-like MFS transporter
VIVVDRTNKNLMIIWMGNFCVAAGATMVLPFLSLYIGTLGEFSEAYVQRWSGYVFGVTFLTAFLFAPIWGRIGDRFGRKIILLITGAGIALCIFLMGKVETVEQLLVLRLVMGVVTGFIPTSIALIATQTAKEKAGEVLGTLQTGAISGSLLGPMIGGLLADSFGFYQTFYITAALILLSTILVGFFVKEVSIESKEKKEKSSQKEVLIYAFTNPVIITIFLVTLVIKIANFSIQPLLALYASQLSTSANIAFLAGFAFSATGLGNLVAARKWGKFGDRVGYKKVLLIGMILTGILYIPQAFVTSIWQLVVLRFLLGIQMGAMMPSIHALIRHSAPLHMQGEIYGYKTSFQFLGNVLGPLLGGLVAASWGISSVFFVTSFLLLLSAFLVLIMSRKQEIGYDKNDVYSNVNQKGV